MDQMPVVKSNSERIAEVAKRFPKGSTVRRRKGIPITETTQHEQATVLDVVIVGIHRDVFLKAPGFGGVYLNPDAYEIVA